MIVSFGDEATADLFHGRRTRRFRRFHPDVRAAALRKLDMLDATRVLEDLLAPPGNRLEALRGDRRGSYSIRASDRWRIVFRWTPMGPADVSLVDYH